MEYDIYKVENGRYDCMRSCKANDIDEHLKKYRIKYPEAVLIFGIHLHIRYPKGHPEFSKMTQDSQY